MWEYCGEVLFVHVWEYCGEVLSVCSRVGVLWRSSLCLFMCGSTVEKFSLFVSTVEKFSLFMCESTVEKFSLFMCKSTQGGLDKVMQLLDHWVSTCFAIGFYIEFLSLLRVILEFFKVLNLVFGVYDSICWPEPRRTSSNLGERAGNSNGWGYGWFTSNSRMWKV